MLLPREAPATIPVQIYLEFTKRYDKNRFELLRVKQVQVGVPAAYREYLDGLGCRSRTLAEDNPAETGCFRPAPVKRSLPDEV
eukprot:9495507-Pyramimonas_sp.AAC.1